MKKINKKIFLIFIVIYSLLLITSIGSSTSIHSNLKIEDGGGIIKYIKNNNTTEININGSTWIQINANDSDFDYEINQTINSTTNQNTYEKNKIKTNEKLNEIKTSGLEIYISTGILTCLTLLYITKKILFKKKF